MTHKKELAAPAAYAVGQEIDWEAPWIEVYLWVELPFWLMTGNTTAVVEIGGHEFEIAIHENYFELHVGVISDSKQDVIYRGPLRKFDELAQEIRNLKEKRPELPFMWRKCKTVLKIKSRCNEDVWKTTQEHNGPQNKPPKRGAAVKAISWYLATLCRAHIPVVNRLLQAYRLATYDYFPHEVSPWDVPFWQIERKAILIRSWLVPYRTWDVKPKGYATSFKELMQRAASGHELDPPTVPYTFIDESDLQSAISIVPSPGEFELLDSLNLMERGDYSGAVRRITTALEVIVESVVGRAVEAANGVSSAVKFLKDTETNFRRRLEKYEQLTGRTMSEARKTDMFVTRKLRHQIVHKGYRIAPSERARAQKSIDTGRWIFNWFENNKKRSEVREKKMALRGLGRDTAIGIFPSTITSDGVIVSKFPI